MAYALQFQKTDTLQAQLAAGASSGTLTTGSFGSPTGTQLLVVDYDVAAKREVISCTISSTALTSITRGLDGTTDQTHTANANVMMGFVPSHYGNGLGAIAANDAWASWTPTYGGFSSPPTVSYAVYFQVGKLVFCCIDATSGTSNATSFTITLPVAAKRAAMAGTITTTDNSILLTTPGRIITRVGSTTADVIKDTGATSWTNSGGKNFNGSFFYEAN